MKNQKNGCQRLFSLIRGPSVFHTSLCKAVESKRFCMVIHYREYSLMGIVDFVFVKAFTQLEYRATSRHEPNSLVVAKLIIKVVHHYIVRCLLFSAKKRPI